MKKTSLFLAGITLVTAFAASLGTSSATHCRPSNATPADKERTADDPFGSCETKDGAVKCGSGTDVGGLFTLIVDANKGAQACAADGHSFPLAGRVGAYKDGSNNATIFIDGGDKKNPQQAGGWQRYDVRPSGQVCARRGSGGTYWTGARGGLGSSSPDALNEGAPAKCQ